MLNFDPLEIVLSLLVFIPAITLHEFCHAKFADLAGDMTPRSQGRVTLNPLAHLDPLGTLMIALSAATGFGIGWGKPVMVNVGKMKNPRWDHFISVVMGPVSNLGIALVCAIIIKSGILAGADAGAISNAKVAVSSLHNFLAFFVFRSFILNLCLFFFNLIPLGPLDGHWLVGSFMPPAMRTNWYRFCHGPGMFIFIALVLIPAGSQFDILGKYMESTVGFAARVMLGIPGL